MYHRHETHQHVMDGWLMDDKITHEHVSVCNDGVSDGYD